jgi:hypothetical protein|tara:strand:+ start:1267 stop:2037 length:771 start_codon:yes stop_codon:yes gene_type:complete
MEKIINPTLAENIEEQGMLSSPNSFGYIFIAAEIEPQHLFKKSSHKRKLECELKDKISLLTEIEGVQRADLFSGFIIPPGSKEGLQLIKEKNIEIQPAKFDIVILIQSESIDNLDVIENNKKLIEIEDYLRANTERFFKTKAQNKMKIAEVDKNTNGVFLFNYFYCKDEKTVLDVWKYTAGWWTENANLTNSTPLSPLNKKCDYALINHCKWNRLIDILPILILGRIGIIKGLNSFVLKNFIANQIVAMPVLYRLL